MLLFLEFVVPDFWRSFLLIVVVVDVVVFRWARFRDYERMVLAVVVIVVVVIVVVVVFVVAM